MTEPRARDQSDLRPPELPPLVIAARPVSRPSLGKRLREAISLCLWVATSAVAAVIRGARRSFARPPRAGAAAAGGQPVAAQPASLAPPQTRRGKGPGKRARLVTHVAVIALVCLPLSAYLVGGALRLVARPLSSSVVSRASTPLEQRSTVVGADGSTLAVLHDGINRRVVPLAEIPPAVRDAVVAAEDKRFWAHGGYDGEAVGRAVLANVQAREVTQGASTITQQLAKQNLVGDDRTLLRKGKELLYAVALEQRFTKEQLLERYLNQVYFGAQAYGVAAAAEEFFDAAVGELSVDQAALLAGLIRAPATLDPRSAPDAATARRNEVLHAMAGEGYLSPSEAVTAATAPLVVAPPRAATNSEPFVVEAVKREFLGNPAFGATEDERRRRLLTGGLQISITVDPKLQAAARAATRWVPDVLGSAIVSVDPRSGRIVALHTGGAAAAGQFDVATQGARQPGSTFKPLVAAAALEAGMPDWQSMVGDGPIEIDYGRGLPAWTVDNFGEQDYGYVSLRQAVVNSVNTAFAQLGVALGPDKIADMAERLGIDAEPSLGPPSSRGPSLALGGLTHGVSPLQLASAYGTFAAGGVHRPPHLIEAVNGPDGSELYRAPSPAEAALTPTVNAVLVDILQDAVAEGTGTAAQLPGWEVLGKTGTSDGPADAWFVGAVPVLSTAVWVGRPDSEERVPGLAGGSVSAPIWRQFMAAALRGQTPVAFASPPTGRTGLTPISLPTARPCPPETCTAPKR